ncbi:MAG: Gluconate 2-dehydrogenase cytochrome c subunit [Herbaspirillum frisingense]|uniref:Gluconate 2-dehydrogenase cytochrome c subunit n=1 Tax=Herbaspirillum frisingense TaxID=92645 RepID=A0A7V8FWG6_9BURK|nr:MAG: Gluconate 2-dehydrogenase cytochrome c subunit [Herbaspirillum frisingense]
MKRVLLKSVIALAAALIVVPAAVIGWQMLRSEDPGMASPVTDRAAQVSRGEYLARAGNCMACHTVRGGAAYAGGRAIPSTFGTLYTSNITPDKETGIGNWNADDFWRALHHGRSRNGSFLYPAFPFTSYTKLSRDDSDALFAYLQSIPPVGRPNQEHALRFPYNQRILLAGWRALYFRPSEYRADTAQSVQWNRGAYLVQGLGHCAACHSPRNSLGASEAPLALSGGMIQSLDWYAPPLNSNIGNGLGHWQTDHLAALLKTGVSPRGAVLGPMSEVVGRSLQYLDDADIGAMALYLKSLPAADSLPHTTAQQPEPAEAERIMKLGKKLYGDLCVDCHSGKGEGIAPDYPPLNANQAIAGGSPVNAIRVVLNGGFPPSTAGNPYPFGMPPFGPQLSDQEVAAVVSYIRNSWDNRAGFVSPSEVNRYRSVPID